MFQLGNLHSDPVAGNNLSARLLSLVRWTFSPSDLTSFLPFHPLGGQFSIPSHGNTGN